MTQNRLKRHPVVLNISFNVLVREGKLNRFSLKRSHYAVWWCTITIQTFPEKEYLPSKMHYCLSKMPWPILYRNLGKPQKKVIFLVFWPLRGGGGRTTQNKRPFFETFLAVGPLKNKLYSNNFNIRIRNRKPTSTRIQLDPNSIYSEIFRPEII